MVQASYNIPAQVIGDFRGSRSFPQVSLASSLMLNECSTGTQQPPEGSFNDDFYGTCEHATAALIPF